MKLADITLALMLGASFAHAQNCGVKTITPESKIKTPTSVKTANTRKPSKASRDTEGKFVSTKNKVKKDPLRIPPKSVEQLDVCLTCGMG